MRRVSNDTIYGREQIVVKTKKREIDTTRDFTYSFLLQLRNSNDTVGQKCKQTHEVKIKKKRNLY